MTTSLPQRSGNRPSDGAIPDRPEKAATATGERAVPYHCPYCADEDLRPLGAQPGAWHCRSCLRAFSVRFLGLEGLDSTEESPGGRADSASEGPPDDATDHPTDHAPAAPRPEGGTR